MSDDEPKAWIKTIHPNDASAKLSALYSQVADPSSGQLDSIMAVHSLHPEGLEAHFNLYRVVMRGTAGLSAASREMIALVVSQVNACSY